MNGYVSMMLGGMISEDRRLLLCSCLLLVAVTVSADKQCPLCGWSKFGSHCYKDFMDVGDYHTARDFCKSLGGELASIHNETELNFVASLLDVSDEYWIGLCADAGDNLFHEDGTNVDFTPWHSFGRNQGPGMCARLIYSGSVWEIGDNPKTEEFAFLCKTSTTDSDTRALESMQIGQHHGSRLVGAVHKSVTVRSRIQCNLVCFAAGRCDCRAANVIPLDPVSSTKPNYLCEMISSETQYSEISVINSSWFEMP